MAVHRYWRLSVTAAPYTGNHYLVAMELRATTGGANLSLTGNGTASASDVTAGAAADAFDNNLATQWGQCGVGQWIKWDFGAGNEQDIRSVTLTNYNSGTANITAAALYYSDDGSAWTSWMAVNGSAVALASTTTEYVPPNIATADITSPVGTVVGYFGANAAPSTPMGTACGYFGAYADIPASMATLSAFGGGAADILAPMATLTATAHNSAGENAADIRAPMAALSIFMGAVAKITAPSPTLSATATGTNWLKAGVTAPMATLEATGTLSGTTSADITAPMASLIGYGGMVASITLAGKATVTASVSSGSILSANIVGPMAKLTLFEVTTEAFCNANILGPMGQMGGTLQAWITGPMGTLTAVGTAVVAATYEAFAINLQHRNPESHDEVTRYTNFPFTHVVRYRNSYFGVAAGGLYLLEGATDDSAPIAYAVKTGLDELGSPHLKNVASAYFAGRLGPDMTVTLYAGEDGQTSYAYSTTQGTQAKTHREKFGRGVKDRYFALGLAGSGDLELAGVELETNQLKRKL